MKNNFTQPFATSEQATAHLIVETDDKLFLQLTELDELDAFYATTLAVTLDTSADTTLQLVKALHVNGFELVKYRELLRETCVDYSYLGDEAGAGADTVILHVVAERTDREITHTPNQTVEFVTLEEYMQNLRDTGMPAGLLEAGVSHLLLERSRA